MKKSITILFLSCSISIFSQSTGKVGINTNDPMATLDVNTRSGYTSGEKAGISFPTLTGDQIEAMDVSGLKAGTLVYSSSASTATTPDVKGSGFWYWTGDTTLKWEPFVDAATVANVVKEPWYTANTSTGATSNTDNIYQSGNIGIGTASPNPGFKLHVNADGNTPAGILLTNTTWNPIRQETIGSEGNSFIIGTKGQGTPDKIAYPLLNDALFSVVGRDAIDFANTAGQYGGAMMVYSASQNQSQSAKGTQIEWFVTKNDTNIPSAQMTLSNFGTLGLGIRTPNPGFREHIRIGEEKTNGLLIDNEGWSGIRQQSFGNNGHAYALGTRSGGTYDNPTYPKKDQVYYGIFGRDGIDFQNDHGHYGGAEIHLVADQDITATSKGARMDFAITKFDTDYPYTSMVLQSDGGVKITDINTSSFTSTNSTDKVVVADANGVLKTKDASAISGSTTMAYTTLDADTTLNNSHHTVRIFNGLSKLTLPQASTCSGRVYILIGSNGISTKNIDVVGGNGIYDDVTNSNISTISSNQRYQIQSDGSGWIVIGR